MTLQSAGVHHSSSGEIRAPRCRFVAVLCSGSRSEFFPRTLRGSHFLPTRILPAALKSSGARADSNYAGERHRWQWQRRSSHGSPARPDRGADLPSVSVFTPPAPNAALETAEVATSPTSLTLISPVHVPRSARHPAIRPCKRVAKEVLRVISDSKIRCLHRDVNMNTRYFLTVSSTACTGATEACQARTLLVSSAMVVSCATMIAIASPPPP